MSRVGIATWENLIEWLTDPAQGIAGTADITAAIAALNLGTASTHPAGDFATPTSVASAISALSLDTASQKATGFFATAAALAALSARSRRTAAVKTLVALGTGTSDATTFTGLPSKYRVSSLFAFDASAAISIATAGLFTAASGGGTAIAPTQTLTLPTAVTVLDLSSVLSGIQTAATLYFYVTTPHVAAATCSLFLEVIDLS